MCAAPWSLPRCAPGGGGNSEGQLLVHTQLLHPGQLKIFGQGAVAGDSRRRDSCLDWAMRWQPCSLPRGPLTGRLDALRRGGPALPRRSRRGAEPSEKGGRRRAQAAAEACRPRGTFTQWPTATSSAPREPTPPSGRRDPLPDQASQAIHKTRVEVLTAVANDQLQRFVHGPCRLVWPRMRQDVERIRDCDNARR